MELAEYAMQFRNQLHSAMANVELAPSLQLSLTEVTFLKLLTGSPAEGDRPAVAPTSICYALRNGVDRGLFSALKRQAVANGAAGGRVGAVRVELSHIPDSDAVAHCSWGAFTCGGAR